THRPQTYTLFPYTPLFRSWPIYRASLTRKQNAPTWSEDLAQAVLQPSVARRFPPTRRSQPSPPCRRRNNGDSCSPSFPASRPPRSEEHTSELQSRFDLVCR